MCSMRTLCIHTCHRVCFGLLGFAKVVAYQGNYLHSGASNTAGSFEIDRKIVPNPVLDLELRTHAVKDTAQVVAEIALLF